MFLAIENMMDAKSSEEFLDRLKTVLSEVS
jgi:hypothetical protein